MADGRTAKILLTVLAAFGGALWGYVLPGSLSADWRWRLIALPAAFLVGGIVWSRLQVETAAFAVDVPMGRRIVITVGMSIAGFGSGFSVPAVLTRSWPSLTWGVLLGVPLALVVGNVAWCNPSRFIKETLF
jgi:hypothetical protein